MDRYILNMEFTGHHEIEFDAENDEQAVQMVEDGDVFLLDSNKECRESEECLPINLVAVRNEDSAIKNNLGMEGEEEIWAI